jgi:hypothetical protein
MGKIIAMVLERKKVVDSKNVGSTKNGDIKTSGNGITNDDNTN